MYSRAPERLQTERLLLRPPTLEDALSVFHRCSSDAEVTRYLGVPQHRSLDEAKRFTAVGQQHWSRCGVGPYLVFDRRNLLVGSVDLFLAPTNTGRNEAHFGFAFARDAWGRGLGTEATQAVTQVADALGIALLKSSCHPENVRSQRVLVKCGFVGDGVRAGEFPNLTASSEKALCFFRRVTRDDRPTLFSGAKSDR